MQKTKGWKPTGREHVSVFRERKPHTLPKDELLEGGEDKGRRASAGGPSRDQGRAENDCRSPAGDTLSLNLG